MSVLQCNRRGCPNIMCDRYSYNHGYLCDSCFEELVVADPEDIDWFMGTTPKSTNPPTPDNRDRFDEEFPARYVERWDD